MNQTLQFYEENAQDFVDRTLNVDMSTIRNHFLTYVKPYGHILDLGCGSGRDSKAFLDLGYQVTAVDGSLALCILAEKLLKQPVHQLLFEDLEYDDAFDAIWASASLLHVPSTSIPDILKKILKALKHPGVFYMSVKQGIDEGERNGRYFTDYKKENLLTLLVSCGFEIQDHWVNIDVRPDRDEYFINVISSPK